MKKRNSTFTLKVDTIDYEESIDLTVTDFCNKIPPPIPPGECSYYIKRFESFMERHSKCKHTPPVYYYGPLEEPGELSDAEKFRLVQETLHSAKDGFSDNAPAIKQAKKTQKEKDLKSPYLCKKNGKTVVPHPNKSYGYKYCDRFSNDLMPRLSPKGKKWLKKVKLDLQLYMEQGVVEQNYYSKYNKTFNKKNLESNGKKSEKKISQYFDNIELNNTKFQSFAFATHPDAYNPVIMSNLPATDLIKIVLTPDFKEWAGGETWEQAWIMAKNMSYKDITTTTWEETKNSTSKVIEKASNKLKEYWNEIFL